MKILFVVSRPLEINSSASLRNINTIKGMLLLGHSVTVVTNEPSPNHPQYNEVPFFDEDDISKIYLKTSITKELSATFSQSKVLNKLRVFLYRQLTKNSIYDSWKSGINSPELHSINLNEYDVVMSSSDPKSSHLIAERLIGNATIKWIQIWGDPFTGDITSTGNLEKKKGIEEKRLIGKASKVFYLSLLTANEMKRKYSEYMDKIFFMPRPYINVRYTNDSGEEKPGKTFSFCGDYNSNVRNIRPLYNAICGTEHQLIVVGNSDINLQETSNVRILPRQGNATVEKIEEEADVLVHISNLCGTQIPGKIYNYSATNKPILFILDGNSSEIKDYFEQFDRYVFCNNDALDIANKINEIVANSHKEWKPVLNFRYDTVITKLLD